MAARPSLDHDAFAMEMEMRKFGVAMPSTPKASRRVLLAQNKSRPKPLATLLGQLENQLICSSPYVRRRTVAASPAKLRRAGFYSPTVKATPQPKMTTDPPLLQLATATTTIQQVAAQAAPAAVKRAAAPKQMGGRSTGLGGAVAGGGGDSSGCGGRDGAASHVAILKPHVRKQVLTLFETWAEQNDVDAQQPLRSSSSGLLRPASCNVLLGRRSHGSTTSSLPSLAGPSQRQRASSANLRPSVGTVDASVSAAVSVKTSALSFEKVLRLYFRHADDRERQAMLSLVEPHMTRLGKKRWIRRIKREHTEKIRMAFLMGDKDGDGMLSLAEFADAVALHRGERPGAREEAPALSSQVVSLEELARIFAAGDKDGNGQLDLDEFLELVASHPKLMHSFEDVLSVAVQRKRDAEQARLTKIFKRAISPTSRGIASPSGMRRRPTLADLRSMHEVKLPDDWERS